MGEITVAAPPAQAPPASQPPTDPDSTVADPYLEANGDYKFFAPPWTLKGTLYCFMYWIPGSQTGDAFPRDVAYSPLERGSAFADPAVSGVPRGGLATVMIFRYTSTPIGPYDELIFATGAHGYEVDGKGGRRVEKKNLRITRIYVSQKYTCWNGRKGFNCPKHLARFEFDDLAGGATQIRVFPHDVAGDLSDPAPAATAEPFFRASYQPLRMVPRVPMTTSLLRYVGIDLTIVQPPVPAGQGSQGELTGSEQWCGFHPTMKSSKTGAGWFDLRQYEGEEEREGQPRHFWPGLRRWVLGMKMEDADVNFSNMKWWDTPKHMD